MSGVIGDRVWGFRGNLVISVLKVKMPKKENFEVVDITLPQKPVICFSIGTKVMSAEERNRQLHCCETLKTVALYFFPPLQ